MSWVGAMKTWLALNPNFAPAFKKRFGLPGLARRSASKVLSFARQILQGSGGNPEPTHLIELF